MARCVFVLTFPTLDCHNPIQQGSGLIDFSVETVPHPFYERHLCKCYISKYPYSSKTDCVKYETYMVLTIFVTLCDAQNRSNNCNSYANAFPIDDIQTCKYNNGPVCPCFLTGRAQSSKNADFSHVHRNGRTPFPGLL